MAKSKQRSVADVTRNKIIDAARTLFSKKGFAATTTQEIASHAGIYPNLIFHHFKNKKNLWKAVKQSFIEEMQISDYKQVKNVKELISLIINDRFKLYNDNPDCCRMMLWQRLEENSKDLAGGSNVAPNQLNKIIIELQKKIKITKELPAEHITAIIIGCIDVVTLPGQDIVEEKDKQSYINNIIGLLTNLIKAPKMI